MSNVSLERIEVRRSIDEWGIFRDSGEWISLEGLFHPDATIRVAWYEGHFKDFIQRSKEGFGKSFAKHVVCGSAIDVRGGRAVAETNVILLGRAHFAGRDCHGETHVRYLDRFARAADGHWQIVERSTVYDHDLLVPLFPSEKSFAAYDEPAEQWPIEYRFLAMRLSSRGLTIVESLPTKGSVAESHIRHRYTEWLQESGNS